MEPAVAFYARVGINLKPFDYLSTICPKKNLGGGLPKTIAYQSVMHQK